MITSILDTDLYKFTMSAAYFKLFHNAEGIFEFNDRDSNVCTPEFLYILKDAFNDLSKLSLTKDEKTYLKSIRYLPTNYVEWLEGFHFDPSKINAYLDDEKHLHIEVKELMYKATLYEVPILATVSELWHCFNNHNLSAEEYLNKLDEKIEYAKENNLKFIEFGTRRRFSQLLHRFIYERICEKSNGMCLGTLNVYLSMIYGTIPSGTMAHEWIQFHQGIYGFKRANWLAMENWVNVYDGDLGIALIDTFTTDSFLRTLTLKQAKLFDGMRQDSGDELEIARKIINKYKSFGIDPTTKTIVFSNALDFSKYKKIVDILKDKIKTVAGIGTNLTCDIKDRMNIVMKLKRCRYSEKDLWEDTIKISDDIGKHSSEGTLMKIAKIELHI